MVEVCGGVGGKVVLLLFLFWLMSWRADWVRVLTSLEPAPAFQSTLFIFGAVELLFACSQLYHTEQKEGTLCNLLMLPMSPGNITYQKLAGCLWGILPTWGGAVLIGLVENTWPHTLAEFTEPEVVFPLGLFFVLCHLTVLCSLYVKWGAVALAMGVLVVLAAVIIPVAGTMVALVEEGKHTALAQIAPAYYVLIAVCGALQVAILFRLEEIAGR